MSLFSSLNGAMGTKALNNVPAVYQNPYNPTLPLIRQVGSELKLYPQDTGQKFIDKGYNLNDAIYSIVGKNAEKFSQPPVYHLKIQKDERKTLREYLLLKKEPVTTHAVKELRRMYKSMVEDKIVDSKLAGLLKKPNRFQSQSEWMEQTFGFRDLTGEANLYVNRGEAGTLPLELLIIPKPHLNLVVDSNNPWEIQGFEIVIAANQKRVPKEDIIMWKYASYLPLDNHEHLRGQAPLEAARVLMQGMNEADERVAVSNKNAGAAGLAYLDEPNFKPTAEQINSMRSQFNNVVNNEEMARKIAVLAGKWGYINFGYSLDDLKVLEQYGLGFKRLCRVFRTPPGIHAEGSDTYENVKQYKRDWVYDLISPRLNQFVGLLNARLLPEFGLDPETNLIDYSIDALPELTDDLRDQVAALKEADWLSDNEKRSASGYEPKENPILDLTAREYEEAGVGGGLDQQMQDLNL